MEVAIYSKDIAEIDKKLQSVQVSGSCMIDPHVLNQGGKVVRSPLEGL